MLLYVNIFCQNPNLRFYHSGTFSKSASHGQDLTLPHEDAAARANRSSPDHTEGLKNLY